MIWLADVFVLGVFFGPMVVGGVADVETNWAARPEKLAVFICFFDFDIHIDVEE